MNTNDGANVAIKPPVLFAGALALGYLLTRYVPIGPGLASPNGLGLAVGLIFVGVGFALALRAVQMFRRAGTHVAPGQPATALVTEGPYRFTRNPIYIGFVLVFFGLSIVLTSVWILLLLVPVLLILQRGVVLREEAYLEEKFGDAYRAYAGRVPRWL
jgi:protein-S-isoprenylcysteine O-methyltransferase Ste14